MYTEPHYILIISLFEKSFLVWTHRYTKIRKESRCQDLKRNNLRWRPIFTFIYFSTNGSWNLNHLDTYLSHFISTASQVIFSTKIFKIDKAESLYNCFHTKRHLFTFKNPLECGFLLTRERSPEGTPIL